MWTYIALSRAIRELSRKKQAQEQALAASADGARNISDRLHASVGSRSRVSG